MRLPNLLVVGVPKSGTGSLYGYLSQHPDICAGDVKEIGYFNYFNPVREQGAAPPLEEYAAHFAHWGAERYAFEATPTYSYGGRPVIEAVQATLPDPRIILSLRNPVDRLWSAYTFQRELGNLRMPFEDYLAECERRRRDGTPPTPRDHMHGLHIGYYADYVPLWLDAFGPRLRVLFADDLKQDTHAVVRRVCAWLEIDQDAVAALDLAPRNTTQHPRSVRAARVAYRVKRTVDQRQLLPTPVREGLRRAYQRINSGRAPDAMAAGTRQHVEELYRTSNQLTAQALRAAGYDALPGWLADS